MVINSKILTGFFIASFVFATSFFALDCFFSLHICASLPSGIAVFGIFFGAWTLSTASGDRLISRKKAVVLTIVCLMVIIPIVWWYYGGNVPNLEPDSPGEDNQLSGQGKQKVLFKYTASFQYLSSKDNSPISNDLFIVFPCPTVDNEPVLNVNTKEGASEEKPNLENVTWQLLREYENDNTTIKRIQIENGIPGEFIEPRTEKPSQLQPWIGDTSHGPKVWYQFNSGLAEAAFYQNEIARIEAKFTVPAEKADEVTLVDNQGGIYAGADGYTSKGHKPICYSMEILIFERVDDEWKKDSFEYMAEEPLPEYAWVELTQE